MRQTKHYVSAIGHGQSHTRKPSKVHIHPHTVLKSHIGRFSRPPQKSFPLLLVAKEHGFLVYPTSSRILTAVNKLPHGPIAPSKKIQYSAGGSRLPPPKLTRPRGRTKQTNPSTPNKHHHYYQSTALNWQWAASPHAISQSSENPFGTSR